MSELVRKPWDRRPGETRQSYEAFRAYLGLGHDRSILKVAHQLGKTRQIVGRWSSEHDWVDRCASNDTHLGAVEMKAREKTRAEMAERWERRRLDTLETKWANVDKLAAKLSKLIDQMTDPTRPMPATTKNIGNTLRLLNDELATKLRIIAEARAGEHDDFDPTTATPEECRAYLESKGIKAEG